MPGVNVSLLSLSAPPGQLAETRQRSEDALRLAAPRDGGLLVLRRLDLGVLPAGAPSTRWEARAAALIAEQRARAAHGAQPGADMADAVWFRSAEEARTLLFLALLSGRTASAWFWRLAVPGWRGLALRPWFESWLTEALADPPVFAELARVVTAAVSIRGGRPLLELLAGAPANEPAAGRLRAFEAKAQIARPAPAGAIEAPGLRAAAIVARLPAAQRIQVSRAARDPSVPAAARIWLTRFALAASAPELAGSLETLRELADAFVSGEAPPASESRAGRAPRVAFRETAREAGANLSATSTKPPAMDRLQETEKRFARSRESFERAPERTPPPPELRLAAATESVTPPIEAVSACAGLFLLIRPLWRMGIEDYCARAPLGFGRALLRHVAVRMRAPPHDPIFASLGEMIEEQSADALTAWRIGADRWLRRRAKRKLSQVVAKRGWIRFDEAGIDIRFRLDDADVELRRRALDLDPGWVGWLGTAVRYHYGDEPLG